MSAIAGFLALLAGAFVGVTKKTVKFQTMPGHAFVSAHHTSPGGEPERWLARSAMFADRAACDTRTSANSAKTMAESLPLLSPAEEEALLREAGFDEPELFYAAFSFCGWVAIAAPHLPSRPVKVGPAHRRELLTNGNLL